MTSPQPNTDRARKHKDGSVLLSIAEDSVCKLNGVGALTWMILEDTRDGALPQKSNPTLHTVSTTCGSGWVRSVYACIEKVSGRPATHPPATAGGTDCVQQGSSTFEAKPGDGLNLEEIVRALEDEFAAINAEGELRYDVAHEQLQTDTDRFLRKMVSLGLLQRSSDGFYSVSEDVSSTTSAIEIEQSTFAGNDLTEDLTISRRETFSAFVGLLAFDLLLKFGGFQRLIGRVARWPIAEPRLADREICRRVRGMVDRAQMYYPKKAMCLQHSAVVTCLLRRRGVPAEMVLAAQTFPPKAHAWAEVAGEVVNDLSSVKSEYRVLRRI